MTMIVATKECWSEILAAFLEFGFIQKELEFQLSQESQNRYEVIFSKKLFTELRASSEKRRDDMDKFLDLDARFDSEPMNGHCKIITRKGCEDLAIIQFAMAITISRLKAEKSKRIIEEKKRIMDGLGKAIASHPLLKIRNSPLIFYKKGYYHAAVRFEKKVKSVRKALCPFRVISANPEKVIKKFEEHLGSW